jgi:phytoene desaturase
LLQKKYRNYPEKYWENKTLAPSCLIFYLGISKKIKNLRHHNLFFDENLDAHSEEIYVNPQWPDKPCFYVCCPSKTDNTVAPEGKENLFILMPIAPDIKDDENLREKYFNIIINRMENILEENFKKEIEFKKSYCINDFVSDYNAFKGNAYGLANTLKQTAVLRPAIRSNKISNLFYAGHLTVPGPGVPPAIISGQIAAKELMKVI